MHRSTAFAAALIASLCAGLAFPQPAPVQSSFEPARWSFDTGG